MPAKICRGMHRTESKSDHRNVDEGLRNIEIRIRKCAHHLGVIAFALRLHYVVEKLVGVKKLEIRAGQILLARFKGRFRRRVHAVDYDLCAGCRRSV